MVIYSEACFESEALFALRGQCELRRDKGCRPFPRTPFPASSISLDEAELFLAQSGCQRRYAPMVFGITGMPFGIIPDLVFGFARNPHLNVLDHHERPVRGRGVVEFVGKKSR
jgi:hypothetical protein